MSNKKPSKSPCIGGLPFGERVLNIKSLWKKIIRNQRCRCMTSRWRSFCVQANPMDIQVPSATSLASTRMTRCWGHKWPTVWCKESSHGVRHLGMGASSPKMRIEKRKSAASVSLRLKLSPLGSTVRENCDTECSDPSVSSISGAKISLFIHTSKFYW